MIPRTKDEQPGSTADSSSVRPSLCGAAVLAVSALLLIGCGGAESSSNVTGESISLERLAQSASTSADATSGRFAFDVLVTFPDADEPFGLSGEGAFDAASERSSFSVDMSSLAKLLGGLFAGLAGPNARDVPDFDDPAGWQVDVIQDGDVGYLRLPALDGRLPDGKSWVRATKGMKSGGVGFDFEGFDRFAKSDPRELLDSVRAVSGSIETVATEELRGVETTHHRAVVDPAKLDKLAEKEPMGSTSDSLVDSITSQSGLSEIPVDIWIDANGLVRKLSMDFTATEAGTSQSGAVSMTFELWDYNEPVEIPLPPASQVADASSLRG